MSMSLQHTELFTGSGASVTSTPTGPRKQSSAGTSSSSSHGNGAHSHLPSIYHRSDVATTPGANDLAKPSDATGSGHDMEEVSIMDWQDEREQRLIYLRQAFCGFFKAKHGVEMQHLGRVICAILGVDEEEQNNIMASIAKLTPAVVATTTFEAFSQNITSLFL